MKRPNVKDAYDANQLCEPETFHERREVLQKAVMRTGIEGTLKALNFPVERSHVWYNRHTGSERTLDELITYGVASLHETEKEKLQEFFSTLENWLPKLSDPNPIIAEAMALSELDAKKEIANCLRAYAKEQKTPEGFVERVSNQGASTAHGSYGNNKGKSTLRLYDKREFTFSLREIYHFIKNGEAQSSLF